jgi:5-methylcytosine-specific restriction endonuclease McrA
MVKRKRSPIKKRNSLRKKTFKLNGLNIPIKGRLKYDSKEWRALKKHCEQRDGGKWCIKRRKKECFGAIHLHHITPLSKGGTNKPANLEWICHFHHCLEHPFMIKELIKKVYG